MELEVESSFDEPLVFTNPLFMVTFTSMDIKT